MWDPGQRPGAYQKEQQGDLILSSPQEWTVYYTAKNQIGVLGEVRNRSRTNAEVEDTWIGEVMGGCRLWLLMKSNNNRLNGWRSENTSIFKSPQAITSLWSIKAFWVRSNSLLTEELGAEGAWTVKGKPGRQEMGGGCHRSQDRCTLGQKCHRPSCKPC